MSSGRTASFIPDDLKVLTCTVPLMHLKGSDTCDWLLRVTTDKTVYVCVACMRAAEESSRNYDVLD